MNLHGIAAPYVGAVNPQIPVTIKVGAGATQAADFSRAPAYQTPASFTGSIADNVLTVSAIASGVLAAGQTVEGVGVLTGSMIVGQLSGAVGGVGTYTVSRLQTIASEDMASNLRLLGQVQPMTWRDLQQVEGLNLSGTRRVIYLTGSVDSVNRVSRDGGDVITIAVGGVNDGEWYVAQVLEQFPGWAKAAITQQNPQ